ncbi:uncharacterized protein LOC119649500 [Hermetia illucens]|uniref:uncharacterized protein LOC119649500 n=1 Tax=Hermetia illucens TaxID=343691 RepID=UPI0018CC6DC8|nr:uncharacterized protein LOC119649500 [Hermetia illucens]
MLKALLVLTILFSISAANRLCRQDCLRSLDPICALQHGVPRQFANECELDRHNCVNGYELSGIAGFCRDIYPQPQNAQPPTARPQNSQPLPPQANRPQAGIPHNNGPHANRPQNSRPQASRPQNSRPQAK